MSELKPEGWPFTPINPLGGVNPCGEGNGFGGGVPG